jgi:hypothetical protein
VRGTCKEGHVTETTSAPGRVTWHGTCATEECELSVYAKRVPKDARPPEDKAAKTPTENDEQDTVREVKFNAPQPKRRTDRGEPRLPDEHAPEQTPAADPGESVRADTVVSPGDLGAEPEPAPAGGQRSGLVDQRTGRPQQQPRGVFRHPLDW